MSTRTRWLEAGLDALEQSGAPGVRIDSLATALALSKGSFHHHFAGAQAFKVDLLDYYATEVLDQLDSIMGEVEHLPPQTALGALTARIGASSGAVDRPRLELAVRAWATQDPDALATVSRIDEARIRALETIWRRLVDDPRRARIAALLPYLVAIGSTVVVPPIGGDELQRVYELLLEVVHAVADED